MGDRLLGDLVADGHWASSSPFMDGETEAQRKGVIAPGSCGRLEAVSQFPSPVLSPTPPVAPLGPSPSAHPLPGSRAVVSWS